MIVERSEPGESEVLRELFVEQLQDVADAEQQILQAFPTLIESAETPALRAALQIHLEETENHVARLIEAFDALGVAPKARMCRGMAGLLEEGQEMISNSGDKDSVALDLALIAAAQKVEHYEISAYGTARFMAQQLGRPDIAMLLSRSLAEEEIADSVLTDCAKPLVSEAKLMEVG
jgi:Mn-containing catalase